jgi:hypothetical protein
VQSGRGASSRATTGAFPLVFLAAIPNMNQDAITRELFALGQDVVDRMGRQLLEGRQLVHLQLIASEFYEAMKAELERTPRHQAEKIGIAAAAEHCRGSASSCVSPYSLLIELQAAVTMLSRGCTRDEPNAPPRCKPQLRVLQGGLTYRRMATAAQTLTGGV